VNEQTNYTLPHGKDTTRITVSKSTEGDTTDLPLKEKKSRRKIRGITVASENYKIPRGRFLLTKRHVIGAWGT